MLNSAVEFIESHLTQPLQVSDVCRQVPLSPWQFQRLFRAHVGDSIASYIRKRRLTESVKRMQKEPELRLIDVALDYQFGSQEAYTRAFRNFFDMTPAKFRKKSLDLKFYGTPKLDGQKIMHFSRQIVREPQIVHRKAFRLIGLTTQIRCPLSEEADFIEKLPPLWDLVVRQKEQLPSRIKGRCYGVTLGETGYLSEESMTYLASFEVPLGTEPPPGFHTLDLQDQEYAAFENEGLSDASGTTMDYIYGFWLPQSNYKRGSGYDFEIFDSRYNLNDKKSISTYYLPIAPC